MSQPRHEEMLDRLQQDAFAYFLNEVNPANTIIVAINARLLNIKADPQKKAGGTKLSEREGPIFSQ